MINQVYTTVLSILNKESRGYVTPTEFNMYSEMAQMGLFEDLFHKYSRSIVKQNNRLYNSEYSDIPRHIREVIDIFTKMEKNVGVDVEGLYFVTDLNFYRLINLDYNGDDIEEVSKLEINKMIKNNLITPTEKYPVYIGVSSKYKIYPTLNDKLITATYIRKPIQPKWTYNTVSGNPLFNPTALDYQDFELPSSMFNELVIKILSYCGIQIREADVIQVSQAMDAMNTNNEQL